MLGSLVTSYIGGYWWLWALLAVGVVYLLGVRSIADSTRLVTTVLVLSLVVVVLVVFVSIKAAPAGAINLDVFKPARHTNPRVGTRDRSDDCLFHRHRRRAAFVEEEAGSGRPRRQHGHAGQRLVSGICYTIVAAALGMATGLTQISAASAADPNLPFTLLDHQLNFVVAAAAVIVLILADPDLHDGLPQHQQPVHLRPGPRTCSSRRLWCAPRGPLRKRRSPGPGCRP